MRRVSALAAVAALSLSVAACGSDKKATTTDAPAATEAPTGSAAPAESAAPAATEAAAATDAPAATDGAATTPAAASANSDCRLDEPLKIGFAADFDLGGIGDVPASSAAKFEVDEINKAGGVGGKPVEFEVKQISQTPQDFPAAQRGVQELIDGGADILLGPPFSDYGLPILEVTKGALPVLFVTSTEIALPDPSRGAFLASFNDRVQASAAAEFAAKKGFKTAVTMSSNDIPYLNVTTGAFAEVFTKGGGTVAKDLSFKLGTTDFSAQVNEIAGLSPQPDVVYSAFFLPEAGVFLKQLRAAGVKSTVVSADGFDASLIWTIGKDAEDVYFTSHAFPGPKSPKVQEFLDAYAKSGGKKIETAAFGALGVEAVQIAVAAAEKACSTKGPDLIKAIDGLSVDTVIGPISYSGTKGTPKRDVIILTVKDGKPEQVDAFYPSVIAVG